jgi:ribonuclease HI
MTRLDLFIDGASKGNPGPSGIGVVLYRAGKPVKEIAKYIGIATNNVAEYSALLAGLEAARRMKADALTIKSDSQLLCRQLDRQYKVRSESIGSLFIKALNLIAGFKKVEIIHVPREQNKEADSLANKAVKGHTQRAESGCPCAQTQGRKVRAPEDNALCNAELPSTQATFDF